MTEDLRQRHVTNTLETARDDARAQEGISAEAMPYRPAASTPYPPAGVDPATLVWAETVSGPGYTHKVLARGTRVRLEDVSGDACAHVLVYNALEPWERLNVADTQKIPWQAYITSGHPLLSGDGRVLATVVDDTSGRSDAFCGTSTAYANEARYGAHRPETPSPSGRDLFTLAATKHGLTPRDLAPSVSFFQGVKVEADGTLVFTGSAGPGKTVDLVAEMPLILLVANVPHPLDPRPEYTSGLLRVHAWPWRATGPQDPWYAATPERRRAYLNTEAYLAARGELR